jgi:hypothetical protein
MKIIFDARHIKNVYSGLARYTYSILSVLIDSNQFSQLEIFLDKNNDYSNNPLFTDIEKIKDKNTTIVFLDAPLFKFKHHFNVSKYVNNSDCDIYFYPHFDMPLFIRKKAIFVIHDLLPLVVDNYILKYKFIKQFYFKKIIDLNLTKSNSKCIAVSQSTKNDILNIINKKYDKKIDVVYEDSFETVIDSIIENIKIKEVLKLKFLFYIGDRRPHKNLKEMIDIFKILKTRYNYEGYFIIAGSERNFDIDIDNYIKNESYIKTIGKVSDEELILLYKNMDALFFLSKYEGFGLPIIEAAKYNKKIIVSNSSSCGEIAPKSALKINLKDEIAKKSFEINDYLSKNEIIDNKNYLENFSWKQSVEKIFGDIK